MLLETARGVVPMTQVLPDAFGPDDSTARAPVPPRDQGIQEWRRWTSGSPYTLPGYSDREVTVSQHHVHSARAARGGGDALTRQAVSATLHCLTGCAIGEVLGLVLATWWGLSNGPGIALAVVLAFLFGYGLTMAPVLRSGLPLRAALGVALAADTVSILTMEVVDNAVVLAVPGALEAGLDGAALLGVAGRVAGRRVRGHRPVNRAHRPWQGPCRRPRIPPLTTRRILIAMDSLIAG